MPRGTTRAARSRGPTPRRAAPRGARRRAVPADGDYLSEINPAAEALVEDIGRRHAGGAALFIDYGFPGGRVLPPAAQPGDADVPLPPSRARRSVRVARAHRHHGARRFHGDGGGGRAGGARGRRLRGAGAVPDRLRDSRRARRRSARPESPTYHARGVRGAEVARPAEMGELFKVLALRKVGRRSPGPGFGVRRSPAPACERVVGTARSYRPHHTAVVGSRRDDAASRRNASASTGCSARRISAQYGRQDAEARAPRPVLGRARESDLANRNARRKIGGSRCPRRRRKIEGGSHEMARHIVGVFRHGQRRARGRGRRGGQGQSGSGVRRLPRSERGQRRGCDPQSCGAEARLPRGAA